MDSKETKIKIEVKIGEVRFPLTVPFSQQDHVRRIETELKLYMRELNNQIPNKEPKTYLAMAAYHFASYYFFLKARYENDLDDAESLLKELSALSGDDTIQDSDIPAGEFGIF
ncbi:MAG: cell division protein ZapA [Muribaculaceae bacterium]|nr:cell division protein ZapA [Muribaculaceae bacterium]MDE6521797.1 cell division protein ZapA [Muribaculaceae bacterium]